MDTNQIVDNILDNWEGTRMIEKNFAEPETLLTDLRNLIDEQLGTIKRNNDDLESSLNSKSRETTSLKNEISRLKDELAGKQYEYDCEKRKRKEAEDKLSMMRFRH